MSSFNRRSFLLTGAALACVAGLSACGFTPAYGPKGAANGLLGAILVDEPTDRDSYLLVQHLETRLGRSATPRFGLTTTLTISKEQVAISANNITNRFNVVGHVEFILRDLADETVLTSGSVDSFTGYSATGTTAATQAARSDAHSRLMVILADQLTTRLIATAPTFLP